MNVDGPPAPEVYPHHQVLIVEAVVGYSRREVVDIVDSDVEEIAQFRTGSRKP
jgi:hypothetical protein